MTLRDHSDGEEFWADNDLDDGFEMTMDDDEILLDTTALDEGDDNEEPFEAVEISLRPLSALRRIEIAREDRWLRSALADFDEYYGTEDFDDRYGLRSSH